LFHLRVLFLLVGCQDSVDLFIAVLEYALRLAPLFTTPPRVGPKCLQLLLAIGDNRLDLLFLFVGEVNFSPSFCTTSSGEGICLFPADCVSWSCARTGTETAASPIASAPLTMTASTSFFTNTPFIETAAAAVLRRRINSLSLSDRPLKGYNPAFRREL
jgi:hypothetical protein